MTTIASQITSLTVVYSTVYSDADQRKHQSSASLAFVRGIHRDRWIPRTKGQLRGKCFHLMQFMCDTWLVPRCTWSSELQKDDVWLGESTSLSAIASQWCDLRANACVNSFPSAPRQHCIHRVPIPTTTTCDDSLSFSMDIIPYTWCI